MVFRSLLIISKLKNARILTIANSTLSSHRAAVSSRKEKTQNIKDEEQLDLKDEVCGKPKLKKKLLYTTIAKTEKAKQVRFYVLNKYFNYIKSYESIIEKRFPTAVRVYRMFVLGMREFYKDFKEYIRLVKFLSTPGNNLHSLSHQEVIFYHEMPKDMRKIAPVLAVSAVPVVGNLVFPLVYYYPQLLTKQFWNIQQISEYTIVKLRKCLLHNKPVFRHLQSQLKGLKGHPLHKKWSNVLGLLGSGVQPSVWQILECRPLFQDTPYHLFYLSGNHARHLLKMHDMHAGWFRRSRLGDRAIIILAMDRAIEREGGLDSLSRDMLRDACFIRGLNPTNLNQEDMTKYLSQWLEISRGVDKDSLSLILHCPVLLAYNQPSNWRLIYRDKNVSLKRITM